MHMKKIYINPEIVVVRLTTHKLIAVSGELDGSKSITSSDDFASRKYDFWDDEEDEDY